MLKRSAPLVVATLVLLLAWACAPSPAYGDVDSHVTGTVTDDATADPIAGVDVTVSRPGGPTITVTTDSLGAYDAASMPAGSYNVRFVDPSAQHMTEYNGGTPTSTGATLVTVADSATTIVDAGLAPAAVLTGTVNVPGATVRLLKASTGATYKSFTADGSGNWTTPAVPVQGYKIRYEAAGYFAEYNDGVPTTGTSGLATADVINPAPYVTTVVPAASLVPR